MKSCSHASLRLSDSDLSSSDSNSSASGGATSESVRLTWSESEGESEGESLELSESECDIPDKISHDNELKNLSIEQKKTEKMESESKFEFVKNDINESVFKELQPTSNSTQDHLTESLSKKRNLTISSSCGEKFSELKSPQKTSRKKKKKKKKKGTMIKRLIQKLR